jgi:hypothetical protein
VHRWTHGRRNWFSNYKYGSKKCRWIHLTQFQCKIWKWRRCKTFKVHESYFRRSALSYIYLLYCFCRFRPTPTFRLSHILLACMLRLTPPLPVLSPDAKGGRLGGGGGGQGYPPRKIYFVINPVTAV